MARRVFITGGARGIGAEIARRYTEAGYEVVAPPRAELDLADPASIAAYFADPEHARAEILINNAAENRIALLEDLPPELWQRIVTINLTAPLLLLQHLLPSMRAAGWGRVVNISTCYSLVSRPGRAAYSMTKSGLNGLTRTAALEGAPHGILVNSVCPGFMETDLTHQNNTPAQIEALCSQIPLGRLGTTREVADLVFYLGSEANTYLTGQCVVLDGGFVIQ